ncbi:MAG: hypothetical protein AAFU03_04110 [Bacteroidota bacterium]
MVQTVEPNGKAAIQLRLAQGSDPSTAAQQFASENKLQIVSNSQRNINGLPSVIMIAQTAAQNEQGQAQQVVSVKAGFISYGGNIYMLLGLAAREDFSRYELTFDNTITSFNRLTDQRLLNRQPERLRIATVVSNRTLQSALQGEGIPQDRLNEFSILNGMQLNDQVAKGTLIKVLQR